MKLFSVVRFLIQNSFVIAFLSIPDWRMESWNTVCMWGWVVGGAVFCPVDNSKVKSTSSHASLLVFNQFIRLVFFSSLFFLLNILNDFLKCRNELRQKQTNVQRIQNRRLHKPAKGRVVTKGQKQAKMTKLKEMLKGDKVKRKKASQSPLLKFLSSI